ncbi:hypothetical protein CIB95_15025 [Lottiidibacillus patelloidae]|uniref:Uncharacterized protein n=1 Tax=Lottiidibacillus patelloidae TaxID=2670334 RepID=A0A263BQ00_9BACI|nr:hypothetical protein [Lottiidibacillus patelloidae]OZM55831.1 hypothetical protein CIB95_15025 [Lottiidibacillus patelloidae]
MKAPQDILKVWNKFNSFPMETLTKAWFYEQGTKQKQRSVSLMKEHYEQYLITGNCFDLTIWLLDEFKEAGIESYPIGTNLHTEDAHVAAIALDEKGNRYLCDLGDQWIQPILVDKCSSCFSEEKLAGYFPAAEVAVQAEENQATINYYRPNGKISKQTYDLTKVSNEEFFLAAETSQRKVGKKPLLECRIFDKGEVTHWEFYNWESWLSTSKGKFYDKEVQNIDKWVTRIHQKTSYDKAFILEALKLYAQRK